MNSQYEKKRIITFDRVKIKSNYKYLLNTKVKFNEMFHSRTGEKTGLFYSSKDDSTQIPCMPSMWLSFNGCYKLGKWWQIHVL